MPVFPSLTPTKNGVGPLTGELHYGWQFNNGGWTAGSTSGYTYEDNPFFDGPIAWSVSVTTGAQQPAITAPSALWTAVAAIFYVATLTSGPRGLFDTDLIPGAWF